MKIEITKIESGQQRIDRIFKELIRDSSALIEIDRKVLKALGNLEARDDLETIVDLADDFRKIKLKVKKTLSELTVVESVNDETKELLGRVQREFETDDIIKQLVETIPALESVFELSVDEGFDIGSDIFGSWISPYEYVRDIFKVTTLILQTAIPKALRTYIWEARNCFALQQHNAVISMCRTILEAAVKDLCEQKGFFEAQPDNIIEINPAVFNQLIKAISRGKLKRRAIRIYYREACPVVHGDRLVNAEEALRVLQETMDVIQNLYSLHGHITYSQDS